MITVIIKPKKGESKTVENIKPGAIENHGFFYEDSEGELRRAEQSQVDQFQCTTEHEARSAAKMFKPTGRYIAIVRSKDAYYVEFDDSPFIRNWESLITEFNAD